MNLCKDELQEPTRILDNNLDGRSTELCRKAFRIADAKELDAKAGSPGNLGDATKSRD
jgi:hypothetical protein